MDGVVRAPSEFSMTLGWPFSMTATQEFVVPRSMPMIFAMMIPLHEKWICLCLRRFGREGRKSSRSPRFGDADQRRSQYALVQAIAFLQHTYNGVGLGIGFDRVDALMLVRIEFLT